VKRPSISERDSSEKACKAETGKSRAEWFAACEKSGATGRAAIGKFFQAAKVEPWWLTVLTVEYEAAKGAVEKDGRPKGYSICSTKSVDASAADTFKAFTVSSELAKWFGAGATIDAKEGGTLKDGDGVRARLTKVRPGKTLAFVWETPGFAEGSAVEILIQPKGAKTGLVVNHTRIATRRDADGVRGAWEQALNRLKERFAG